MGDPYGCHKGSDHLFGKPSSTIALKLFLSFFLLQQLEGKRLAILNVPVNRDDYCKQFATK